MDIKTYMQTVGRQVCSAICSVAAASTDAQEQGPPRHGRRDPRPRAQLPEANARDLPKPAPTA